MTEEDLRRERNKRPPRMLCWAMAHDSHGFYMGDLIFLPEGELPETPEDWRRVSWLDEPL